MGQPAAYGGSGGPYDVRRQLELRDQGPEFAFFQIGDLLERVCPERELLVVVQAGTGTRRPCGRSVRNGSSLDTTTGTAAPARNASVAARWSRSSSPASTSSAAGSRIASRCHSRASRSRSTGSAGTSSALMAYTPSPQRAAAAAAMSARLRRSPPVTSTRSGASGLRPSSVQPSASRLAARSYDGGSASGAGVRRSLPCSRASR
ncbi:hypothetical protein O1M54_43395 [Streptomyces diastatochromogenes]|nr:hypothetical protein [Streptomyces diastatochromogenes]